MDISGSLSGSIGELVPLLTKIVDFALAHWIPLLAVVAGLLVIKWWRGRR